MRAHSARLDVELVSRGLAPSRNQAAQSIAEGMVLVDGETVTKASAPVRPEQAVEVVTGVRYVSRAARKLVAALDEFRVPVAGRLALDVGASTGGFTQVLLERGARRVVALDVGHGQLDPSLAADERVVPIEGANARDLTPERLGEMTGSDEVPDLVVADLSFISLRLVLPAVTSTVAADADFVVLIKPQFEVGRSGIRAGLVRDQALRSRAVRSVLAVAFELGLGTVGILPSPIAGSAGNREYLAWLSARNGRDPTEWSEQIARFG